MRLTRLSILAAFFAAGLALPIEKPDAYGVARRGLAHSLAIPKKCPRGEAATNACDPGGSYPRSAPIEEVKLEAPALDRRDVSIYIPKKCPRGEAAINAGDPCGNYPRSEPIEEAKMEASVPVRRVVYYPVCPRGEAATNAGCVPELPPRTVDGLDKRSEAATNAVSWPPGHPRPIPRSLSKAALHEERGEAATNAHSTPTHPIIGPFKTRSEGLIIECRRGQAATNAHDPCGSGNWPRSENGEAATNAKEPTPPKIIWAGVGNEEGVAATNAVSWPPGHPRPIPRSLSKAALHEERGEAATNAKEPTPPKIIWAGVGNEEGVAAPDAVIKPLEARLIAPKIVCRRGDAATNAVDPCGPVGPAENYSRSEEGVAATNAVWPPHFPQKANRRGEGEGWSGVASRKGYADVHNYPVKDGSVVEARHEGGHHGGY